MANLKLNNVVVVAESSGTATLQNSIIKVKADGIKASDGTAAITIADTTGAVSLASNLTVAGNATVTVCHSRSKNLEEITRQADILVAAIGMPFFVKE